MKVVAARIEATLQNPTGPVLLLYGEDAGLVRLRSAQAIHAATGGRTSPFQVSTLLKEEHGRLTEEAQSRPMDGSRRVVRVLDAGDGLTAAVTKLAEAGCAALIVLEAGPLTPRSKLRLAAEKAATWAAIACYAETAPATAQHIRNVFAADALTIDDDALQYLQQELGGDTARRQRELDKLALFAAGCGKVSLDDAVQCCAAENDFIPASAFEAAMLGNLAAADMLLRSSESDGATGPGILAAFSSHLHRLVRFRLSMESGLSGEDVGRSQRPPLYPRQLDSVLRQTRAWPSTELLQLLNAVSTADIACKRSATRDVTIATKVVLDAARHAFRRRQAGQAPDPSRAMM